MAIDFSYYSKLWLEEKKNSIKYSTYCAYLNIVVNKLDNFFVEKGVDEDTINEFVYKLKSGSLSNKTIKEILIVLRMVLIFMKKHNIINYSITNFDFMIKEEKNKVEVLSKKEFKILYHYLISNFTFVNLGILIDLCTGIRIGELCALTWGDIDLDNKILHITKTLQRIYIATDKKTKILVDKPKSKESLRDIPIPNSLIKYLKGFFKILNKQFYIITNSITPVEPRTFRDLFYKVCDNAGIRRVKFHTLRHTFATRLVETSSDYKAISAILGHSSITITLNLYVHPNDESKRKCIEKMLNTLS